MRHLRSSPGRIASSCDGSRTTGVLEQATGRSRAQRRSYRPVRQRRFGRSGIKYLNEYELAMVMLNMMKQQANNDPKHNSAIKTQEQTVDAAANLLQQVRSKTLQLLVRSPRDGVIIEPPAKTHSENGDRRGSTPRLVGKSLCWTQQRRCFLRRRRVVCGW